MPELWIRRLVPLVLLFVSPVFTADARDFFLTIGGGSSPAGNQISLEKNAQYFQRVLRTLGLAEARHDVLFSDGNDPGRDLQLADLSEPLPAANLLLAQLLNQEDGIRDHYRSNQVSALRGPATRAEIDRWFEEMRGEIQPDDHLLIYFTGHGGKGGNERSNFAHLWNGEKITVEELVARLDKLPPELNVALVMVQCYSGGFANVVFNEAQLDKGPSEAHRCGFFATTHDRVAAGCTSDVDEENYQEYSSYFWSALSGEGRLGQPNQRPDYDGDGHTSFEEAHSYALIHSDTIDVSVRTSDTLLRAFSKTKQDGRDDLLTADTARDTLLASASPADRAVYQALATALELGDAPAPRARELLAQVKKEKEILDKQKERRRDESKKIAEDIFRRLKSQWPELANRWHPRVQEILVAEGPAVVQTAQGHPRYSEFARLHAELDRSSDRILDLRRRAAKCDRFLNVAERIALAANLCKVATPEQQARYNQLLASEQAVLERVDRDQVSAAIQKE